MKDENLAGNEDCILGGSHPGSGVHGIKPLVRNDTGTVPLGGQHGRGVITTWVVAIIATTLWMVYWRVVNRK